MKPLRCLLSSFWLLTAVACNSIPTQSFDFKAIDAEEKAKACLIVVNDDWGTAIEKEQFVNVDGRDTLNLTLPFEATEVEVMAVPLTLNDQGKVAYMPRNRTDAMRNSNFADDTRRLRLRDPRIQLFILRRKGASTP
jgi:hypothetical protein